MTKFKKVLAGVAALGALALGGSALAQAGGNASPQAAPAGGESQVESSAPENSATDSDNVQSGDQSDKGEQNGTEQADGPEGANGASDQGEQAGSEQAGDEASGGHQDEPGNADADHENQGNE